MKSKREDELRPFTSGNGLKTTESRSKLMSRVKGKNTKPEVLFRKSLWGAGFRFRIHVKDLPGSPDIAIKKYKLAIFIDGEFWHGFDWAKAKHAIKTNQDFWIQKIETNIARDLQNNLDLESIGYTVFRFWEKEVRKDVKSCIEKISTFIKDDK